jgi:hypothetical protein
LDETLALFLNLHSRYPLDPKYIYESGKLFAWTGKWKRAEHFLSKSLKFEAFHNESLLRLGNLYIERERWRRASLALQELLQKDPKMADAYVSAARLNFRLRRFRCADSFYRKASSLTEDKDLKAIIKREFFYNSLWIRPAMKIAALVAQEQEDDLQTKQKAARRYAKLYEFTYSTPLLQKFLVTNSFIWGNEREKNLVALGEPDNYDVDLRMLKYSSKMVCGPNLNINATILAKQGVDRGETIYPFRERTRCEPSLAVNYKYWGHNWIGSFVMDSFIHKNFQQIFSAFMGRKTIELFYEYQLQPLLRFWGISGYYRTYEDALDNEERRGRTWVQWSYPKYESWSSLRYQFEIGGFKDIETNYYSFKFQREHIVRITLWKSWNWLDLAEIYYQHAWRFTRDLSQPVNATFFLKKQYLQSDRVNALLRKVISSNKELELEGTYYHDTAGYWAWIVRGHLLWTF